MEQRKACVLRNPFSGLDRDSFPGIDRALTLDDDDDNDDKIQPNSQEQGHAERISPDHSVCSHSSFLNMSIGARAALNEHLRHVALHGIDGGAHQQTYSLDTSESFERLPQDEVWDHLLDGNISVTTNSSPSLFDLLQPVVYISENGDEEIEIAFTDVSTGGSNSDYFNSSRIWQLVTPERNKQIKRTISTRRGDEQYEESDSGSQTSGMMYLYNVALGMHEQPSVDHHNNSSFLSLGVDLSRISNSDISDVRSSPADDSFHQQRDMFSDDILPYTNSLTPSRRISPRRLQSSPSRRSHFSPTTEPNLYSQSINTVREHGGKENCFNLPADIGLSPIAAQAGSIAGKLGRPSRRHHPCDAFPSFSPSASPNGLGDRVQNLRMGEPSPISQTNSGFDTRNFPVTVSENCMLDMDDRKDSSNSTSTRTIDLKPRDPSRKYASSLSSISVATSVPKPQSSSGSSEERRQYRTVVPPRVFMDEPGDFPFQDDSFSSRSDTVGSTSDSSGISCLPGKSLLVSFDDAAGDYEVALDDT